MTTQKDYKFIFYITYFVVVHFNLPFYPEGGVGFNIEGVMLFHHKEGGDITTPIRCCYIPIYYIKYSI